MLIVDQLGGGSHSHGGSLPTGGYLSTTADNLVFIINNFNLFKTVLNFY